MDCHCFSDDRAWQSYSHLKNCLPSQYDYKVCMFSELSDSNFQATLRMAINDENEAKTWKQEFEELTKTTLRKSRTHPHSGLKLVFKEAYHCQHSGQRLKESSKKNTECTATMTMTVKRCVKYSKSTDTHLPSFPTVVELNWAHNHSLNSAAVLKHRDVSNATKDEFISLFNKGHTPSKALDFYKSSLQMSQGEDYVFAAADRSTMPDEQSVYRLYQKHFDAAYGEKGGANIESQIEDMIRELKDKGCQVAWESTDDNQMAIAIITPVMRRVLTYVSQASEMMFVDSTRNCDRHGVRMFLLLTHCPAGGVPVGCLLTTSENYATLCAVLDLYISILPEGAFGTSGHPIVIMTDDCESLRTALYYTFPQSTLLLCTFLILQAVWRWLWDIKHGVQKQQRQKYFSFVKSMLHAQSEEEIEAWVYSISEECAAHPKFVEYVENLSCRKEQWDLCYHKTLISRGNNTNNFVEAAMKIFKDKVLHKTKTYNILQLMNFVTSHLEDFYCRLLIDIANGRCENRKKASARHVISNIPKENISLIDNEYTVKSELKSDVTYSVDINLGICTCPKGWNGGGCKHQAAVGFYFGVDSVHFLPTTPQEENHYYFLATGNKVRSSWFAPLKTATVTTHEMEQEQQQIQLQQQQQQQPQQLEKENITLHDPKLESNDEEVFSLAVDETVPAGFISEVIDICTNIDNFASSLKEKLVSDPSSFVPAVSAFLSSGQKLKTDSSLISALFSFGKYSGCLSKGKMCASSERIGIQPTAIARRKHKLLGRNIVRAGSQKSQKIPASKEMLREVIPSRKAPHNLSVCVSNDEN